MPRKDGTGPEGKGELTGRRKGATKGKCPKGAKDDSKKNKKKETTT
jgi:hypothetical protein